MTVAFHTDIPVFHPVIPALYPVIPAKAGIQTFAAKPSPEIRYKQQPADPLSLYGLTRVGFEIRLSSEDGSG